MKPLTIAEIEDARKRTADTASALVDASVTLLDAGYPAFSFFLSHAACEEIAKIPTLVGLGLEIIEGRSIDWKRAGQRLTSHVEKIKQAWVALHINADETFDDASMLAKARAWFAEDGPARTLREHSLYAGVSNIGGLPEAYRSPADVIDQEKATEVLAIARAIVTNRVRQEEVSRGYLSSTPPGLLDIVDRHLATVQARRTDQT